MKKKKIVTLEKFHKDKDEHRERHEITISEADVFSSMFLNNLKNVRERK